VSLRPASARWFELLATHADLTRALETLALTGCIELESHQHARMHVSLQDMQTRLQVYTRLAQRYQAYWPRSGPRSGAVADSPGKILDNAIRQLLEWERRAAPIIKHLETLRSERVDLLLLQTLLAQPAAENLDFDLLSAADTVVLARLFVLPTTETCSVQLPASVISRKFITPQRQLMLLVGTREDLEALSAEMALKKCRVVPLPRLPSRRQDAQLWLNSRLSELEQQMLRLQQAISDLETSTQLADTLGDIRRLDWFLDHVSSVPASDNFAWITGWSSDRDGRQLRNAISAAGVDAILHYPPAPADVLAPMLLSNPWWARPFELFARLLGTPGRDEADPSRLLALLTPLLFGYMFADVGQGLVLALIGLALQRRWPVLRLLVANGIAAMLFGLVFGSVFGREDILPALWLHPIAQPLPVLAASIAAGVVIILLGLSLSAVEFYWRGEKRQWLLHEAPVAALYLATMSALVLPADAALSAIGASLVWYISASLLQSRGNWPARAIALLADIGTLVETLMQLLLNTVSFVRVGAFALAHAGLSMAFNIMADAAESTVIAFLVLLLGNVIVIALEGMVVGIQTTRLILFEFFIRFLRATGRVFKPLPGPTDAYREHLRADLSAAETT
jgi:V/A-type H+-transporting ATPase subunit I